MKRTILTTGILIISIAATSCLDNEDFEPMETTLEQPDSSFSKDGSEENDSLNTGAQPLNPSPKPPTGGEEGQNPIKP